jgi:hypothetical protein
MRLMKYDATVAELIVGHIGGVPYDYRIELPC